MRISAPIDGVNAIFIGPGDLAAALSHLGDPRHPEVQAAIGSALERIGRTGKAAGIFALDWQDAATRLQAGACFVSIGTDVSLLVRGAEDLLAGVRSHLDERS